MSKAESKKIKEKMEMDFKLQKKDNYIKFLEKQIESFIESRSVLDPIHEEVSETNQRVWRQNNELVEENERLEKENIRLKEKIEELESAKGATNESRRNL